MEIQGRKMIVGLGNPDPIYWDTRLNAGYDTLKMLHQNDWSKDGRFWHCEPTLEGTPVVLVKPKVHQNYCGPAVVSLIESLAPSDLLIVYYDVNIELGRVDLRRKRSNSPHRGIKSVREAIGDKMKFARLRVGVGPDPGPYDRGTLLRSKLVGSVRTQYFQAMDLAANAAQLWATDGYDEALQDIPRDLAELKEAEY